MTKEERMAVEERYDFGDGLDLEKRLPHPCSVTAPMHLYLAHIVQPVALVLLELPVPKWILVKGPVKVDI
jgi:hypothetical protein